MSEGVQDDLGSLRAERDRFVALSFCNADLLFELDNAGAVTFAVGATQTFTGQPASALRGIHIKDLVDSGDRRKLDRLLRDARAGRRIDDAEIRFAGPQALPLTVSGFHMSDLGGHTYLAFRVKGETQFIDDGTATRVEGAEVYDRGSFADIATRVLASRDSGDCKLTMIELGDFDDLRGRLDDRASVELSATMGSLFRANSLHGDLAGQIDDNRFGLVHDRDTDIQALSRKLEDYAREADPEGTGLAVESATIDVDAGAMSEADTAKALVYAINRFCDDTAGEFTIRELSESFSDLAAETVEKRGKFVEMIREGAFEVAFQPICDMKDGRPHHFEALVRFDHAAFDATPYEFVTFAEEVGIICEFDLAMCRKVLDWLSSVNGMGYRYMTAVNISGRSLSSPDFVRGLFSLLDEFGNERDSILFEITESAKLENLEEANRIIQALRKAGHIVCLDDFGAGVSAFQYLSALHVDLVKIDGAYVIDAISNKRSKALLKAMAGMCRDLGVTTVAEMIEEESVASLVRDCGIEYGQGYLYGKPNTNITAFESPKPVSFLERQDAAGDAR